MSPAELERRAREVRFKLVEMSHRAKTAHLASALSVVDILLAAYQVLQVDPQDPARDRLILSKGHAISALYAVLAYRGFFPLELLDTYNQDGGSLPEQPSPHCVPGIELATGSLGHGLPFGLGLALAQRIQRRSSRVMVVMSDGECQEGSVWEAAMFAPAHRLDRVCAVIDYNKWQATGRSNEVMAMQPLRAKWEAFGWRTWEVDGHDLGALQTAMREAYAGSGSPAAIVAHTVKGRGVSFMTDDNNWHYRSPSTEEVESARRELGLV